MMLPSFTYVISQTFDERADDIAPGHTIALVIDHDGLRFPEPEPVWVNHNAQN